jgi:hypothetical protein
MHSFQPSRGRIVFQVLCAIGVAASFGGAWLQTDASALLAASAIATLYGLVHFFDLFRRDLSRAAEPQRIDFAADGQADLSPVKVEAAPEPTVKDMVEALAIDPRLTNFAEPEAAPVETVAIPDDGVAQAKVSRKGSRRTASSQKKSKAAEPKPQVGVDVAAPHVATIEEVTHVHVAPLFEPDPYVRMPRQGFGRRGQI